MRKYIPHIAAGAFAIIAAFLVFAVFELKSALADANAAIAAQQAQLIGEKEQLQKANVKLGLAESSVVSKDVLLARYKKDVEDLNIQLGALKGGKKPTPSSSDSGTVIASGNATGSGSATVTPGASPGGGGAGSIQQLPLPPGIISYSWRDTAGRFHLEDPDIASPGDESFTYKLKIRVNGYILEDPTGKIRGRQVIARELVEKKNPDGSVSVEEGPPLPIEDNIYLYSIQKPQKKLSDIFGLRGYAFFDTSLNPGVGLELLNIGRYFDYVNIGAGPFISIEVDSLPGSLQSSLLGIGLQYTLVPPAISTNIGLGLGIATPADDLFGRFQVTGSIIFYLTN